MSKTSKGMKIGTILSLALALVFLLSTPASAERMGASLRIFTKDGVSVEGELIAVKGRTLILIDDSSRTYVRPTLDELSQVLIKRKSQALAGATAGLLLGAGIGAFIGHATTPPDTSGWFRTLGQDMATARGGVFGALGGVFLGVVIDGLASQDEKFMVTDMTQEMQGELLMKLRSKSRFPDEH